MRAIRFAYCAAVLAIVGCPKAPHVSVPERALVPVSSELLAGLQDDGDYSELVVALDRNLAWLASIPSSQALRFGPREVSAANLTRALTDLRQVLANGARPPVPRDVMKYVAQHFDVMACVGRSEEPGPVLVTGYYEPIIAASLTRSEQFATPIYATPADLVGVDLGQFRSELAGQKIRGRLDGSRLLPYWTREEINDAGSISGRGLELAWGADPVDVFFLEVQGSGTLRLPDGGEMRVGYAEQNGHRYSSVGKVLVDEGKVAPERISMQSIREYLRSNPHEIPRVLNHNASYVFFRELSGPPEGSLGVPVTPQRSVAMDHRLFPKGALALLVTTKPKWDAAGSKLRGEPLVRFVFNQDTGGAIRGPGRADLFWGRGEEAVEMAGHMEEAGQIYFLVPKP